MILLPVVLFFLIWNALPTMWMVGMSFREYSLTSATKNRPILSVLENFVYLITSADTWSALSKTFLFVVGGVFFETVLGILLGFLFLGQLQNARPAFLR